MSSDANRRIELDPASVRKEADGKQQVVLRRIVFEKTLVDPRTSGSYSGIKALTRYNFARSAVMRRSKCLAQGRRRNPARGGGKRAAEMPVRTGSLDDKLMREVCRPRSLAAAQSEAAKLAEKANEAAADLRHANEAMIQKEPAERRQDRGDARCRQDGCIDGSGDETGSPAESRPRQQNDRKPSPCRRHILSRMSIGTTRGRAAGQLGQAESGFRDLCQRQAPVANRYSRRHSLSINRQSDSVAAVRFRSVDNGHTIQVAVGGSGISLLGKRQLISSISTARPRRIEGAARDDRAFRAQGRDGHLAVVAVLIERGAENPFIRRCGTACRWSATSMCRRRCGHRSRPVSACLAWLLHLHGLADDAAVPGRRPVAGAEAAGAGVGGADRDLSASIANNARPIQ